VNELHQHKQQSPVSPETISNKKLRYHGKHSASNFGTNWKLIC